MSAYRRGIGASESAAGRHLSLIERESAKVSPRALSIEIALPWVKIVFGRKRAVWGQEHFETVSWRRTKIGGRRERCSL